MPRIAILGAGPIGLEAALAAAERGDDFTVYESAPRRRRARAPLGPRAHVHAVVDERLAADARRAARTRRRRTRCPPATSSPTSCSSRSPRCRSSPGASASARACSRSAARGCSSTRRSATRAARARPFRLLLARPDGSEAIAHADVVIDATGTYGNPNRLGDGGIDAVNERAFEDRIERFLPRLRRRAGAWAGKTILLTGSGHSAQTAARQLAAFARDAPGTRVVWAVRSAGARLGRRERRPAARARRAERRRGAARRRRVGCRDRCGRAASPRRCTARDGRIVVTLRNGAPEEVEVDRILALNGGVGDHALYRQLQVHECYATSGPMNLAAALLGEAGGDCLAIAAHGPETLRNPEPGFFILGAKSYGRNSQFLLQAGWQQVDDVFGSLIEQGAH